MIFNIHVGPVRTKMINTQKMNNSEMSTQNIPNLRVCYLDEIESKGISVDEVLLHVCYMDEIKLKIVIFNACSLDKSESEIVHISGNTIKVKDAKNERKDEKPSVVDNSVINALSYF